MRKEFCNIGGTFRNPFQFTLVKKHVLDHKILNSNELLIAYLTLLGMQRASNQYDPDYDTPELRIKLDHFAKAIRTDKGRASRLLKRLHDAKAIRRYFDQDNHYHVIRIADKGYVPGIHLKGFWKLFDQLGSIDAVFVYCRLAFSNHQKYYKLVDDVKYFQCKRYQLAEKCGLGLSKLDGIIDCLICGGYVVKKKLADSYGRSVLHFSVPNAAQCASNDETQSYSEIREYLESKCEYLSFQSLPIHKELDRANYDARFKPISASYSEYAEYAQNSHLFTDCSSFDHSLISYESIYSTEDKSKEITKNNTHSTIVECSENEQINHSEKNSSDFVDKVSNVPVKILEKDSNYCLKTDTLETEKQFNIICVKRNTEKKSLEIQYSTALKEGRVGDLKAISTQLANLEHQAIQAEQQAKQLPVKREIQKAKNVTYLVDINEIYKTKDCFDNECIELTDRQKKFIKSSIDRTVKNNNMRLCKQAVDNLYEEVNFLTQLTLNRGDSRSFKHLINIYMKTIKANRWRTPDQFDCSGDIFDDNAKHSGEPNMTFVEWDKDPNKNHRKRQKSSRELMEEVCNEY